MPINGTALVIVLLAGIGYGVATATYDHVIKPTAHIATATAKKVTHVVTFGKK